MSEIEKRRNHNLKIWGVTMFLSFVYLYIVGRIFDNYETLKYLFILMPVFILTFGANILKERADNYNKGIKGEDEVEKILRELNVKYQRNVRDISGKFDYDFHLTIQQKHYILEVKNYSQFNKKLIDDAIKQARGNARQYRENFLGDNPHIFVEPLVILVGDPRYLDTKDDSVIGLNLLASELIQFKQTT